MTASHVAMELRAKLHAQEEKFRVEVAALNAVLDAQRSRIQRFDQR